MTQQFKTGDTVKVLRCGTAGNHMEGVTTRVVEGNEDGSDFVYVEDPTGWGLFTQYGDTTSWIIDNDNLELAEEALADWEKELLGIETKQEETVAEFKVGVTVEVIERRFDGGPAKGDKVKVIGINKYGGSPALAWSAGHDGMGSNKENNGYFPDGQKGWFCDQADLKLVTEKPKARSQEIKLEDVQVGDLIVCFFDNEGAEIRIKGIADHKDNDGDWLTEGGGYLTYEDNIDTKGIYLLERPEVKEPEIAVGTYWIKAWGDVIRVEVKDEEATFYRPDGSTTNDNYTYLLQIKRGESALELLTEDPTPKGFDALDKTVKYFLKSEGGYSDYVLAYEGGRWTYGWVGDDTRVGAARYEIAFTEGNSDWAKPVPYEPTDLEKHTEAGTIGNRYRSGVVEYKVTKKGKVKGIVTNDPLDTWANVHWSYETFKDCVDRGTIYKI